MGYLVCKNCRGYYKLQDGESPEDFSDKCACGGNLRYAVDIEVVGNRQLDHYYDSSQTQHQKEEETITKTSSNKYNKDSNTSQNKKIENKPYNKTNEPNIIPYPFTRRWVFIFGIMIIFMGLTSPMNIGLGLITLILGIFLFFTDSWILYLIIFSLWGFGGIIAWLYSEFTLVNILAGIIITAAGGFNLIGIAQKRKKSVSGQIK